MGQNRRRAGRGGLALLAALALGAGIGQAGASAAVWVRSPVISPDGRSVAFVARGQVRVVPITGGASVPLTPAGVYSSHPVWSPDGRHLAFASTLSGSPDVYVAALAGGQMQRRTFSSAGEVPTGFSPDGAQVLYRSARLGDATASTYTAQLNATQLYSLPAAGGRSRLIIPTQVDDAQWNPSGTLLVYAYDSSQDPLARQQRVAANAGELWLYDPAKQQHRPLVLDGHDARNPVWSPDGQAVYYLSERSGPLNVWQRDLKSGQDTRLTSFSDQPVRGLSISRTGDLVFAQGGRLYLLKAGTAQPQRLEVSLPEWRDDSPKTYLDERSSEFEVSRKGNLFALVARGNLFLMDEKGQSYPVTRTPQEEREVSFSPDGGFLVYASARRDAQGVLDWRLYKTRLPQDPKAYAQASAYTETLIDTGPGTAQGPQFSPDGSKLAFVYQRREVRVLDLKTAKVTVLYKPDDYHTSYSDGDLVFHWSPDSQQLLVPWRTVPGAVTGLWAVVPADGSAPLRPVTERLAQADDALWTRDGTQIVLLTGRDALRTLDQTAVQRTLYRVFVSDQARSRFLDRVEAEPEPKEDEKEQTKGEPKTDPFQAQRRAVLEDVLSQDTLDWAAPLPGGQHLLAAEWNGGWLLWRIDLLSGRWKRLGALEEQLGLDARLRLSADGKTLYLQEDRRVITVELDDLERAKTVTFRLRHQQVPSELRRAAFDQFWLDIRQTFYRADLHGQDWQKAYNTYAPYLDDLSTPQELAELIDELGGTLSASHLFPSVTVRGLGDDRVQADTATLGFFQDHRYDGPGLKISAILPGGPLDRVSSKAKPGDVVLSVNGQPLPEQGGLDVLLDGQVGRKVQVGFQRGQERWTQELRPISLREERLLNRQRVIERRREQVAALSKGQLAYTFLPEMDNDAFITAYNDLLGGAGERVGVVVDVRGNRGGDLDRQLMTFLSGKAYAQLGRDQRPWAVEPADRWRRPSALLVDSFSYSDGSIFPQAFQDAGLGPIVGQPLLNTGTALNQITSALIPELEYSIPVLPMRRLDGSYYENRTIRPDIPLPHDPNAEQAGRDPVLEAAVRALLQGRKR